MTSSIYTPKYKKFRQLLINARKEAGYTQQSLALKISKPQSYVSKYENGERRIDFIEFLIIAEALCIDIHKFVDSINE